MATAPGLALSTMVLSFIDGGRYALLVLTANMTTRREWLPAQQDAP